MREQLRARVRAQLDSFWLVPGATALALGLLAVVLLEVDRRSGTEGFDFAYQGGPGAARDLLAVLAGSVITVAGLTFSIMIVTLQLVAAQYTPRALRTFLGDRMTQLVAGAFVGVFAYALIVLRSIRGDGEIGGAAEVVPSLSVTVGIVLGLVVLVLLIAFVNHMSRSIQISHITSRIARDTRESLKVLYPHGQGDAAGDDAEAVLGGWGREGRPGRLDVGRSGFVQAVGLDRIAEVAQEHRLRIHVIAVPGDFVTRHTPVVEVWPAPEPGEARLRDELAAAFSFGSERDLRQDAVFGLRQLADIAARALSPGVNDPTTAITCLRHAQDLLEQLASAELPDRVRRFESGVLVVERRSFGDALEPIAEAAVFAAGQPLVSDVVLDVLASVARVAAEAGHPDRARDAIEVAQRVFQPLFERAATREDGQELATRLAELSALRRV